MNLRCLGVKGGSRKVFLEEVRLEKNLEDRKGMS